jgi:hypothetical protein
VIGVDVSPTMIDLANRLNRHPEAAEYVLNYSDTLDRFASGTFDFVYSDIVLQHLSPEAAERYIVEFLRVLSSGGIAVFQLPSHKRTELEQPPLPTRMPPEAYRARVSIVEDLPRALTVDGSATVVVELENLSSIAWDQPLTGSIRLGNHWRGLNGEMLVQDDGRAVLPSVVQPGHVVRVALAVQAPPEGGTLLCEFDLVHEGISWFCDMGSRTASVQVVVTAMARGGNAEPQEPATSAESHLQAPEYPDIYAVLRPEAETQLGEFPMHGVRRETVVTLVKTHGGTIVLEEDDERGGPEWRGFRYFVSKDQMAGGSANGACGPRHTRPPPRNPPGAR